MSEHEQNERGNAHNRCPASDPGSHPGERGTGTAPMFDGARADSMIDLLQARLGDKNEVSAKHPENAIVIRRAGPRPSSNVPR
jgi:hypothetical protein